MQVKPSAAGDDWLASRIPSIHAVFDQATREPRPQPFCVFRVGSTAIESDAVNSSRISTTAAGYGVTHRRQRQALAPLVASGQATCVLCGEPIAWDADWDLAHAGDRRSWLGASHAVCNRGDAGRKTARLRWERSQRRTSEDW